MPREVALDWLKKSETRVIAISDRIWELAEVGLQEYESSKLLAQELRKDGFKVDLGVAGMPTAFVASYGSGRPVIGILAEYDALPGVSQKAQPTREPVKKGAPGHGCGHNLFGAGSAAAALAIREAMARKNLAGTVKLFGCPAEETLVGKVFMVRDGLFAGVDVALSWHPASYNSAWMSSSNALNSVKFNFHGLTSHAAADPERGKSALDAVELMNVGANYLREHISEKARLHYVIPHGGGEPNVVPDYAQVWYYVRAPKRDEVEQIYGRVLNIAKGACLMTDTTMDLEFLVGCYEMLPNRALSDLMLRNMRETGPPKWSEEDLSFARKLAESMTPEERKNAILKSKMPRKEERVEKPVDDGIDDPEDEKEVMAGSTDVGDVSWVTPTANLVTATCVLGMPGHSWQEAATSGMSIGHKGMILAAKTLALTGIDLLTKPEELKKVREEFELRAKGFTYRSPIPPGQTPPLNQLAH